MQDQKVISILINDNGTITSVYDDILVDLYNEGQLNIKRASHVEPGNDGKWYADLSPVGGGQLGPYDLRQQALNAEVEWLRQNL